MALPVYGFLPCYDYRLLNTPDHDSTSFIIPLDYMTSIRISNIKLLFQEPRESVDFKLIVPKEYYSKSSFKFDLEITFANYVHEFSQDYSYIIQIQVQKEGAENHESLFVHEEMRSTNKISLKNVTVSRVQSQDVFHYCCYIRRFNYAKSTLPYFPSSNDIGSNMLKDGIYSDVSLVVGHKAFKAHKQILSLQSKVFKEIFSHDIAENQSGILKIDDFDARVIEAMLLYVYTSETKNLPRLARELFKAAHAYQLDGLKFHCEEYLIFNMNRENVIDILELARIYDIKKLRNGATSFVRSHEENMVVDASYREFLCRDLSINTVVSTLLLCTKYPLRGVQREAFEFVKNNNQSLIQKKEFLDLFITKGELMQKLYVHIFT